MPADHIALVRGINVGGHNRVPMSELRDACAALGWSDVRTYIQSGNIVFHGAGSAAHAEAALEEAIADTFDLHVAVIVRTGAQWAALVERNPMRAASDADPSRVLVALAKQPLREEAEADLRVRAAQGEHIVRAGDALWCRFDDGVGRTRLTPAVFDRAAGSPVTMRNWRTVLKLRELLSP